MSFEITLAAELVRRQVNLRPQLVFEIDGVTTKFGVATIFEYIRVGDEDLYIDNFQGEPWYIGGTRPLYDQGDYVQLGGSGGSTSRITQQLQPDKGVGTSVVQLTISLIDKNEEVSELISPGFRVDEILGRNSKVYLGFYETAFPNDFICIFRGVIEDIESGAGSVKFTLSSSEQKKRQILFPRLTTTLASGIAASGPVASIALTDATGFYVSQDANFETFVRIGDEWFKYTGRSGNTLTGVTRNSAPFNYGEAEHTAGDDVTTWIRLTGNGMDLARKLMLSGLPGAYKSGVDVTHFNIVELPSTAVTNALFFFGVDVETEYGLFPGELVTTTGAANPANNVTDKAILSIEKTNDGSYVVLDGVSFVTEPNSSATCSFKSKWNTLGYGCRMAAWDVDLEEFDRLYSFFLSDFEFDFRLDSLGDAKTFIEEQIMRPMTCFSIQRKGRVSLSYHIGPIPGAELLEINRENVENAPALKLRRSLSRNYYNTVIFEYDLDPRSGRYLTTKRTEDTTSTSDFGEIERAIVIRASGMRTSTAAATKILQSSNRFLNRYKRAAEFIDDVQVRIGDAFNSEVADIVLLDTAGLNVTDIQEGSRSDGRLRVFQVINKTLDIARGKVNVALVDTNFSAASRYALIAPASIIKSGASGTTFVLRPSFNSSYGLNEYLKWERFGEIFVRVRSEDGVTRNAVRQIDRLSGNTVILKTALPFTPQAGDIMEFSVYNDATDKQKFVYGHMRNADPFDDGKNRYQML